MQSSDRSGGGSAVANANPLGLLVSLSVIMVMVREVSLGKSGSKASRIFSSVVSRDSPPRNSFLTRVEVLGALSFPLDLDSPLGTAGFTSTYTNLH